jgi:hypothetical protein
MPRALKDFGETKTFTGAARRPHWDKFDVVLLGTLTAAAILAMAALAYIGVSFLH